MARQLSVEIEEGSGFVRCPHCFEQYWSEDGHPAGTLCPVFGDKGEAGVLEENLPGRDGFLTCPKHETRFWYEDLCPDCEAEYEQKDKDSPEMLPLAKAVGALFFLPEHSFYLV